MQKNENSVRQNCHVFEYINAKNEKGFLHSHIEATEIIFVKKGPLDIYHEQIKYTLNEGDIFVINPEEQHFTEGFCGTHILVAILGSGIISSFYRNYENICNFIPAQAQAENKIQALILQSMDLVSNLKMNKFAQTYIGNDLYDKTIIKLEILKVYSLLAKYFNNIERQKSSFPSATSKTIEDFIKNNLEKNISIKDFAKLLNYSESYTGKIVKKILGGSFKKAVTKHRIDKACELLYDTDYSIEFISEQCGFNTSRAFFKQFSNIVGMSPSQYRKSKFKVK